MTGAPSVFSEIVESVRNSEFDSDEGATRLLAHLSDDEMLWLLDGDKTVGQILRGVRSTTVMSPFEAGRIDRVGIPGLRFTDGPRGVSIAPSTSFPVSIARAATWDPDIERRVGAAIGAEARAYGANMWGGLCVNVAPAPGWGRAQESYGEDPLLVGEMGVAAVAGSKPWVITSVKHYALNSMEEARFEVDVRVAEDILHERYLPHFRRVVEVGVDSVMSSYNSVNGEWAGQNRHLLTDILRSMWDFKGFVHTDWVWGLRDPVGSVGAGQDVEMPLRQQRAATLPAALRSGKLSREDVRTAATRILRTQIEYALRAEPTPPRSVIAGPAHRALAREIAQRGTVLLRNEEFGGKPLLPLVSDELTTVAVLGRLSDTANLGDTGSSRVIAPSTVSVMAGLKERLGHRVITGAADASSADAATIALNADVAIVVVGPQPQDEGESLLPDDATTIELLGGVLRRRWLASMTTKLIKFARRRTPLGGDRANLHLHHEDVALIRAVAAANPRTIVIVIGGGTQVVHPWDDEVGALLVAWYPGMEGGRALADLLLGDVEPGGRLPVAIPRQQWHLPQFDWRATSVTYDWWWGQRKLDHDDIKAAYPLGYGLGYTTITADEMSVSPLEGESFAATVTVSNTGDRDGREVVQVYAVRTIDDRPVHHLVGFTSVAVAAGQSADVVVRCSVRPLQRWTREGFVLDESDIALMAGGYAGDPAAVRATLVR